MQDVTLALTDDEAAALAVLMDGSWRTPLPTVEETDEEAVAAAILRGRRSLFVRDLADSDGAPRAALAQLLEHVHGGPVAAFQLVGGRGEWVPDGLTLYLYGESPTAAATSHVLTLAGVHYFRIGDPGEGWSALVALAGAYHAEGFDKADEGDVQPTGALLSVVGPEETRTVQVAQGRVSADDDGIIREWSSLPKALDWLTETVNSAAAHQL